MTTVRKGDDIRDWLIQFAARIISLSDKLPRTYARSHVSRQLLRSGTAPAAHHEEARSAESPQDFIHNLKIAAKKISESEVWMRIVVASGMQKSGMMASLIDECQQLQRILNASIKTARESTSR